MISSLDFLTFIRIASCFLHLQFKHVEATKVVFIQFKKNSFDVETAFRVLPSKLNSMTDFSETL